MYGVSILNCSASCAAVTTEPLYTVGEEAIGGSSTQSRAVSQSLVPDPPADRGLPLLGHALELGRDPMALFVRLYRQHGPIFSIRLFRQPVTVIGGVQGTLFAKTEGREVLTKRQTFQGLTHELGSEFNMTTLEGDHHDLFRRASSHGYSRKSMSAAIPLMVNLSRRELDRHAPGEPLELFPFLQRLVSIQLGWIVANTPADDYLDDLLVFMRLLMRVHLTGVWPKATMQLPAARRAKSRVHAFAKVIVHQHMDHPPGEHRDRDLIDDFLSAHAEDPERMPLNAVYASALGPFLAGQDTVAAATAYLMHALLTHPEILSRVQSEVDTVFDGGAPSGKDFRKAKTLHAATIESMRRYPVAPLMPQHAAESFSFNGHRVEKGSMVFVAHALTQFLEEHFERPFEFDVDRPRAEPHTYAPFGVGTHTCGGAGLAELQVMVNVAILLREANFEITPFDYKLRSKITPPAPVGFRVLFSRRNH